MTTSYEQDVPLSVVEGDAEGEFRVWFEWTPGTPESGRYSGPPENYDPGSPDEFFITRAAYIIGENSTLVATGFAPHEEERIIEWLDENWDRPEPDHPDY